MATLNTSGNIAVELVCNICKPIATQITLKHRKSAQAPSVTFSDGTQASGLLTTMKALVRLTEQDTTTTGYSLLGEDLLQQTEVEQWLEYCLTQIEPKVNDSQELKNQLKFVNEFLVDKVYMVGFSITLADLYLFSILRKFFHSLSFQEKEKFINVSRWFQQIQNHPCISKPNEDVKFLRNLIYHTLQ